MVHLTGGTENLISVFSKKQNPYGGVKDQEFRFTYLGSDKDSFWGICPHSDFEFFVPLASAVRKGRLKLAGVRKGNLFRTYEKAVFLTAASFGPSIGGCSTLLLGKGRKSVGLVDEVEEEQIVRWIYGARIIVRLFEYKE